MASIATNKAGNRRILFTNGDGERKTIYLGSAPLADVETVKGNVEAILSARMTGEALRPRVASWVAEIAPALAEKLAAVGLIQPRAALNAPAIARLGPFIDDYIRLRHDVKKNTLRIWHQSRRLLVGYFGADRPIAEITTLDATAWRLWLMNRKAKGKGGEKLSEATVRKHCGFAKHFINAAVDAEHVSKNPFRKLPSASIGNDDRQRFVTHQETWKCVEKAPDADWRAIIILSRFGGLRCPSETLALRWTDVLWDEDKLRVPSPKTERLGKGERIIPLFPEVRRILSEMFFDPARDGSQHIINRYRHSDGNLRTQLARIVRKAGLVPWPRIFHNLRASRETELQEKFPAHVVCDWIGNSEAVARKHYLMATADHFARAVADDTAKTTRQTTQQTPENVSKPLQCKNENGEITGESVVSPVSTGMDGNRTHLAPLQTPHRV